MHNEVHHGKGVGILVCDNAKGVIEDNTIACNGRAGIAILSGGDPVVRQNKIHNGLDSGVLVSEKGKGRIENNDIFCNMRAGVVHWLLATNLAPQKFRSLASSSRTPPMQGYARTVTPNSVGR